MATVDENIKRENVAEIQGEDVLPLSTLAARSEGERAEKFEFNDADEALLAAVLSEKDPAES